MIHVAADRRSIADEAFQLRGMAEAGPIGKRHTSFELYALLAGCMRLAERCSGGAAYDEIRGLVIQQPHNGNRRYVERGSDAYTLVCRFVFGGLKSPRAERSNASRYAHCLREAAKQGINSDSLSQRLAANGGINALFLGRPTAARSVQTRCLYLVDPVMVPKQGVVVLRLRRLDDGRFDVLTNTVETTNVGPPAP